MNKDGIKKAIMDATRFISVATKQLQEMDAEIAAGRRHPNCPKESGATRRASLDLTRSLADMRRPG